MEQLHLSSTELSSDVTFDEDSERQPDGFITVVYKDHRQYPERFDFSDMSDKGWGWRRDENGTRLVVRLKHARVEIPEIGILKVIVTPNGDEYTKWRDLENAAEHVIELESHLDRANEAFDKAREVYKEWLAVRSTSGSSTT